MFHFLLPLTQVLSFAEALLLKLATFFCHKNQETDVDGHFSSINRPFLEYQHLENSVWNCYSQIKMKFLNHHPIPVFFVKSLAVGSRFRCRFAIQSCTLRFGMTSIHRTEVSYRIGSNTGAVALRSGQVHTGFGVNHLGFRSEKGIEREI